MTTVPGRSPIRTSALARRAELEARYPDIFRPPLGARVWTLGIVSGLLGLFAFGLWYIDFSPQRVWNGLQNLAGFLKLMVPPSYGTTDKLWVYLEALAETVAMAFLGTLLAAILAVPLALLAAKNVAASRVVHFLSRRTADTIRAVDPLIWALIWVNVVGLGPFAGVLAIMSSDIGSFGKLFSEAIEAADKKPVEGVTATGGRGLHQVRFGLLPQVLPVMLSQVLYYIESNTRSATIIGIVGAGGIGLHFAEQIRTLEWQHVSFLILIVLATVATIDALSARLRFAIIGTAQTRL